MAGPVFAAAVILPEGFQCEGLTDSKQLTEGQRRALRPVIEEEAVCYAVGSCSPGEIDAMNILWASVEAMHRALGSLTVMPEHILVDGNRFRPFRDIPHSCMVKGTLISSRSRRPGVGKDLPMSTWRNCTSNFRLWMET